MNLPRNPTFSDPSKYGISGVLNFYLTNGNISLGVWHVLPDALKDSADSNDEKYFERVLGNGQDVVIYNHGNSGNRIASHRIELYEILRKHFHVIAFDYRGKLTFRYGYGELMSWSSTVFRLLLTFL